MNSARITRIVLPPMELELAAADWASVRELHAKPWHLETIIEPQRSAFPISAPYWERCRHASELSDLLRLEVLYHRGGIYLDADVELWKPLDALRPLLAFAAWESHGSLGSAVLGAQAHHHGILEALRALTMAVGHGEYPAITSILTTVMVGRTDVLLLPPSSFYPFSWDGHQQLELLEEDDYKLTPWSFGCHHWWATWRDYVEAENLEA